MRNVESDAFKDMEYVSDFAWSAERPHVLVVCCADGRLQESVDDFLDNALGIKDYDRLFMAGGPGALATSGFELGRTDTFRQACLFLLTAHQVGTLCLIFHGPGASGPDECVCAHYRRLMPHAGVADVTTQQNKDALEVLGYVKSVAPSVKVHLFRAEVDDELKVHFVPLAV